MLVLVIYRGLFSQWLSWWWEWTAVFDTDKTLNMVVVLTQPLLKQDWRRTITNITLHRRHHLLPSHIFISLLLLPLWLVLRHPRGSTVWSWCRFSLLFTHCCIDPIKIDVFFACLLTDQSSSPIWCCFLKWGGHDHLCVCSCLCLLICGGVFIWGVIEGSMGIKHVLQAHHVLRAWVQTLKLFTIWVIRLLWDSIVIVVVVVLHYKNLVFFSVVLIRAPCFGVEPWLLKICLEMSMSHVLKIFLTHLRKTSSFDMILYISLHSYRNRFLSVAYRSSSWIISLVRRLGLFANDFVGCRSYNFSRLISIIQALFFLW